MKTGKTTAFEKFDSAVRTVMSVSREELRKREKEWKRVATAAVLCRGLFIRDTIPASGHSLPLKGTA